MTRRAGGSLAILVACAVLAIVGAAVLDDYGVSTDEDVQRLRAETYWRHFADGAELRFKLPHNRFYGVAFDLPLLLAEKALDLDDMRGVHLLRHAASHLLFLAGALSCALLTRRMTGSALAALLALALFVLQPRIYAHSFFNSKDIPALALFAVCLWLAHRAFRRGGAGAFLLCGAGVAVLTNLRLSAGLTLAIAVAAARVLDLALASGAAERRRALASIAAFAAGWAGVLYAVSPWMWAGGPAALIDAVETLARHNHGGDVLFQGRIFSPADLPPHYFPVWFAVSTPPVLLALGLAGLATVLRRGLARPGAALRNTPARFALLVAACWAGPPLAAALSGVHTYNGWRHVFFIHAPFCVLAALGAAALVRAARRMARDGKTALGALAGAGAAAAGASMILLHPHQQVYFNGLEDRTTPWRIRDRYDFGYWGAAIRAGLERALAERPDADPRVCSPDEHLQRNMRILRREDRTRIAHVELHNACDTVLSFQRRSMWQGYWDSGPIVPPAWSLAAYGSTFLDAFDMDAVRAAQRRMGDPVPDRPPDIAARFDVRIHDGMAIYVKADCVPREDLAARFFLHVEPADPADLLPRDRRHGFDNRDFRPPAAMPGWPWPPRRATWTRRGDRCLVAAPLPDYPIRRVRTGQFVRLEGGVWRNLWEGEIDLAGQGRR